MERGKNGEFKWTHVRRLYRDWGAVMTFLKMLTLSMVMIFAFMTVLGGFKNGFSLKLLTSVGAVLGIVILGIWMVIVPSYYIWAWANGGVDEWECELDRHGINGRKIAHNQGRLKFLRSIAWIMMLFPMKLGQRMALHNFLYDKGQKEKYFDLSMLRGATCDEKRGKIAIDTLNGIESIYMPREVYAEVAEFIEVLRQKKRAKRKPAGAGKRKPETVSETAERTTAPSTRRSTRSEGARGTPRSGTTPSTPWPADRASGR